ncbi:M14 family metallopeptidase [Luteimonas sp. e5]
MRLLPLALAASLLALPATPAHGAAVEADERALTTHAERSGFVETGRYDEVIALCDAFARAHPDAVRCFDFGTTPEGRPMKALAISRSGALDAAAARKAGLPVVLAQGGIHAGEIDGKDAGFWLLRDLLAGRTLPGVLERQVLLFVPVFNVDGHENFRAWNRPNQRGPAQMGFRTTAQRYNLNRDYMKADSPEMQAMLRLVEAWDPLVEIDLHATNGAQFQHDISITAEPVNAGDEGMRKVGRALRDGIIEGLRGEGHLPLDFYPSFVEYDNPASGFSENVPTPRFSHGYFQLRNRVGILVETHSWRPYVERVQSTRRTLQHLLELVARNGARWQAEAHAADRRGAKLAGRMHPLEWKVLDEPRTIEFQGHAYTRSASPISGALMTRYDESVPEVWRVPLRNRVAPALEVRAPDAGYLVPAAWAARVAEKLDLHGIDYRRLEAPRSGLAAEVFRVQRSEFAPRSMEGRQRISLHGEWQAETRDIGAGALFVPIAQPRSRLLMGLLEPQAPDSLAAWGDFHNAFERKEYMESYVAEAEAERMLASDAALKAEFERRLAEDAEFAASPAQRLEFFYRRHPAWDSGFNHYPVLRLQRAPN